MAQDNGEIRVPSRITNEIRSNLYVLCRARKLNRQKYATLVEALEDLSKLLDFKITVRHFKEMCERNKLDPLDIVEKLPTKREINRIEPSEYHKLNPAQRRQKVLLESNRKQTVILNSISQRLDEVSIIVDHLAGAINVLNTEAKQSHQAVVKTLDEILNFVTNPYKSISDTDLSELEESS